MSAVLELRSVGKTYPPPAAITALTNIDLTVDLGETVSITGSSGSGKSTLLNVLGTLERPTTGTVRVAGADIHRCPTGSCPACGPGESDSCSRSSTCSTT